MSKCVNCGCNAHCGQSCTECWECPDCKCVDCDNSMQSTTADTRD